MSYLVNALLNIHEILIIDPENVLIMYQESRNIDITYLLAFINDI